jgi:hypothetical protein
MTNWKEQFTNEFGIHFKDSAGELQFALAFIEDLLENTQDTNKPTDSVHITDTNSN